MNWKIKNFVEENAEFRELVKASGLSTRKIAAYLDRDGASIRAYSGGRRRVPPELMEKLRRLANGGWDFGLIQPLSPIQKPATTELQVNSQLTQLLSLLEAEGELARQRTQLIEDLSKVLAYPVIVGPTTPATEVV